MYNWSKSALKGVEMLTNAGYEAYFVGGCVRDSILGREFNDYDITTSALPDEIKKVFSDYTMLDIGIKHGTVTVFIDNLPLEITTYRIDGEYSDNRHPKQVEFSRSLCDDLSRRDFTVNALAYNDGVVDLFGGLNDINNKIVRCVGDPDKRFYEDALRIIRALRFASVLGFKIETETAESIKRNAHLLKNISAERVNAELTKLICGQNAGRIISEFSDVFDIYFEGDSFVEASNYIDNLPQTATLRFACFFLNDKYYKEDLKALKSDNNTYKTVCHLIERFNDLDKPTKPFVKRFLNNYGYDVLVGVCKLKEAYGHDVGMVVDVADDIIERNECYKISQLLVNGDDVSALGFDGKKIGVVLNTVLELVVEEKISNNKEEILSYIKENLI